MACEYQNQCRLSRIHHMLDAGFSKYVCDTDDKKSVCFCPEYQNISGLENLAEEVDMTFEEACRLYDDSVGLKINFEKLLDRARLAEKRAFLKKEGLDPDYQPPVKLVTKE